MNRAARPPVVRMAIAALAFVAGVAACGGDDDVSRRTFQSELRSRTTIPNTVAECITERVFDTYDQDEINEIYRAPEVKDLPSGSDDDLAAINQACFEQESGAG